MKQGQAPLKRRAALAPGKPLDRRTPLKQTATLRRTGFGSTKSRRSVFDDRQMREAWIAHVLATAPVREKKRCCPVCDRQESKQNPLQGHHIVAQETIRRHVRSLRLPAREAARLLARLRWDVRNGLPVCTRCHDLHTRAVARIPLALIGRKARQFARELLCEYQLDRYYAP